MRIIFMGTPEFAVPSLKMLIEKKEEIVAVITRPDRKKGRGMKEMMPPVKQAASGKNLNILQPEKVKNPEVLREIKGLKPDIIIVVGYGEILNKEFLSIPVIGCINVHASLLPKYRGSAPIQWAILQGETRTGITIQYVKEKLDSGNIILQKEIEIKHEENYKSLYERLANLGAQALYEALNLIKNTEVKPVVQNESEVISVRKIVKEDGLIDWNEGAIQVNNKIRALNPWPGTYTFLSGRRIKIINAGVFKDEVKGTPGEITMMNKDGIVICCGRGAVFVKKIQPEAKREMSVQEFISGYHIKAGMKFEPGLSQVNHVRNVSRS